MSKHKRSTKEQILSHLKVFNKSGLSVTGYCEKYGIAYATFYKWRSRYKHYAPSKKTDDGFIAIDLSPETSRCEVVIAKVEHPKGYSISFYQDCPPSFLAETLKHL